MSEGPHTPGSFAHDAGAEAGAEPQSMNGPTAPPRVRTGVVPNPRAGLQSALFLGGLVAFVAIAGIVGVVLWGPEKQVASRHHFASNPPASASADAPSPPPEESAEPESAAAPGAAPEETAPAAAPKKKTPRRKK